MKMGSPVVRQLLRAAILLSLGHCLASDVLTEDPMRSRFKHASGHEMTGNVLLTAAAGSRIQCSLLCLSEPECKAANFRAASSDGGSGGGGGGGSCDLLSTLTGQIAASTDPGAAALWMPCSCRLLKNAGYKTDGVYRHRCLPAPLYCDMTYNKGGWTLLTASVSTEGWSLDNILQRNADTPGLDINYSILGLGEQILSASSEADRFIYRLEASGRRQWGGIWHASTSYTLTGSHSNQTSQLMNKFSNWEPTPDATPLNIVPWINRHGAFSGGPILTTCEENGTQWFGTLVTAVETASHGVSPWIIHNTQVLTGPRLYWIKEWWWTVLPAAE